MTIDRIQSENNGTLSLSFEASVSPRWKQAHFVTCNIFLDRSKKLEVSTDGAPFTASNGMTNQTRKNDQLTNVQVDQLSSKPVA